jgi:leucyl-tRNA synthetase
VDGEALAVSQAAHKTLKAVQADYDKLAFNKAVARIYEFVNALAAPLTTAAAGKASSDLIAALREAVGILIRIVAPMTPHLAEECWRTVGGEGLVATTPWPSYEDRLVADDEITLPVQINGKKRADLTIARDADQTDVEAAVGARSRSGRARRPIRRRRSSSYRQRIVNVVV